MHKHKSLTAIANMKPEEKYALARAKMNDEKNLGAVGELVEHLKLHQNTKWIVYNSHLAKQIPRSYAGHAFSSLQRSVLHYEIIRLCTFWDPVDLDSRSIPTIVALSDSADVFKLVYESHYESYAKVNEKLARDWGRKAKRRLKSAVEMVSDVQNSELLDSVKNYRDKIAHQLEQTNREKRGIVKVPRYGDERKLLGKTITVTNNLYLSLNGTSFDWQNSKKMHSNNAEAFWKGINISVLR